MRLTQLINLLLLCTLSCHVYTTTAQSVKDSVLSSSLSEKFNHRLEDNALPIVFHKLGDEDNAPQEIQGVLKDQKGFLWINAISGIYRYDGIHFKKIGKVTSHLLDYNFTHHNPPEGTNYYRLQQFDLDGRAF